MKRYVSKPPVEYIAKTAEAEVQHSELGTVGTDFDIDALLAKSALVLQREVHNIMLAGAKGKLDAAASRDLVSYIKLLTELKAEKQKELANMTQEQLEALTASAAPKV